MPDRNIEFGKYGAQGIKASEAAARQLDALASFVASPITSRRGLMARLHYLTRTDHARQAAKEAGLTVSDRTLKAWLSEKQKPSARNLEKIENAYRFVRRQNVAKYLLTRLNRGGRGTRVEFHPLNQSGVPSPRQRVVGFRTLNVRRWDGILAAWAADDSAALDTVWTDDVLVDLGSQWGQYEYVTNVGFAA